MSAEVIKFPTKAKRKSKDKKSFVKEPEAPSDNDVSASIENIKNAHIDEAMELIAAMLFDRIAQAGFDMSLDDPDVKHSVLIYESIRSILCKHYGIYHPLQDLADAVFTRTGDESFRIVEKIQLTFKPCEQTRVDEPKT